MTEKRIETGSTPEIIVEQVDGNLDVKGWDQAEVELRASPDSLNYQEADGRLSLRCTGSLEMRVPFGADMHIQLVHGQARLRRLEEPLQIGQVYGSLALREVASAVIESVYGEMSAREINGALTAGHVRGNAYLRSVQGDATLERVDGNVEARGISGEFRSKAEGNLRLSLEQMTGETYEIRAAGNLYLELPVDASARLSLTSEGQIKVKFPGQEKSVYNESTELLLGEGQSSLSAHAGGHIYLSSQQPEWTAQAEWDADTEADFTRLSEDISRQVEVQVAAQMEAMTRQLNEQMERLTADLGRAGMPDAQVERIVEQARRSNERAQERAQEKMRKAQEKIERTQEKMQRKVEYRQQRESMRGRPPMPPMPPRPPSPPGASGSRRGWGFEGFGSSQAQSATAPVGDPVSEEERLMILRMLEQKKISIAEAEQLLSALESREGSA